MSKENVMRQFFLSAAISLAMMAASPAFAGGKNGLGIGTGKGGLIGSLLGGSRRGSNGIVANVSVKAGKRGVLGLLLGGGGHGGRGGGCGCH